MMKKFLLMLLSYMASCNALGATPMIDGYGINGYALKSDGTVWVWGGDYNQVLTLPIIIDNLTNVVSISGNVFLKGDGTVWTNYFNNPATQIAGISHVQMIASGGNPNLALKDDGTVWGWGDNQQGELGAGIFSYNEPVPVQAVGLTNIVKIAIGGNNQRTSFALKGDGSLWAWGGNYTGKFGNGTTCGVVFCGNPVPVQIAGISGVIDISVGESNTAILKNDGTVWLTGGATGLTFNQVPGLSNVIDISAGRIPTACCNSATYAVKADGTVVSISNDGSASLNVVSGLSNIVGVTVPTVWTYSGVYAIANDGKMFAWGNNDYGQLGNGLTVDSLAPVEVGVDLTPPPPPYVYPVQVPAESTLSLIALAVILVFIVILVNLRTRRYFKA